jgi:hypothetical protein
MMTKHITGFELKKGGKGEECVKPTLDSKTLKNKTAETPLWRWFATARRPRDGQGVAEEVG